MVGIAVLITGYSVNLYLSSPIGGPGPQRLRVERGTTLKMVLEGLHQEERLLHPRAVYLYARLTGQTNIKTGAYELLPEDSPKDVLSMLVDGRVRLAGLTVVEGHNRWQVRDRLAKDDWIPKDTFDALCDDQAFLKEHQIPGPNCEGYLFPETYSFARGTSAEDIFAALLKAHREAYEKVLKGKNVPKELNHREFVTLASIVEKETGAAKERPRIACVFYNRLLARPPWKLQTDPTVIYAATLDDPNFDGNIKRSHLRTSKNPYNTYTNEGLPPGPIANPGLAALSAVAKPISCRDFFFVSKNNGEHVFCPDLACHEANVRKWQIEFFRRKKK